MAASDKTLRDQYTLDIVFAVTSILLLISVIMMFAQDYNREFKREQRLFRDVESAVSQRLALQDVPSVNAFVTAQQKVKVAKEKRESQQPEVDKYQKQIEDILAEKEIITQQYQLIKAKLESTTSFYNIAVEDADRGEEAKEYRKEIDDLQKRLVEAKAKKDAVDQKIQSSREEITKIQTPLNKALAEFKNVNEKLDIQVQAAVKRQWTVYDLIRSMPILDGFASPYKIKQYTLDNVPIDYNFKQTTRYDRCTTCHQGIDRPAYTKEMLAGLKEKSDRDVRLLKDAREALGLRKQTLAGLPEARNAPSPRELDLAILSKDHLTDARINEYCAHPRLDLYVGPNSKHPAEKFGCTSCHAGQGSATSFNLASHTPNDPDMVKDWRKQHDWSSNHYWDYPMLPQRFIESSCIKCHHEVTGLIGKDNRVEAPKLVRGYNLIREVGCFGCHEIQGRFKGKDVGPDLRLEHSPPLDELPAADREKILSDPETSPGNLRKVGPSLFRLSEKTNREWAEKWLKSPRDFRPTTKMPHFYMLSNNKPSLLKEDKTGQERYPDAEIASIVHYLFNSSDKYLEGVKKQHADDAKDPAAAAKDELRYAELRTQQLPSDKKLAEAQLNELNELLTRMRLRKAHVLRDLAPDHKGDAQHGRLLFSERGCLACHSHTAAQTTQGTINIKTTKDGKEETVRNPNYSPGIVSEADFGPDLSQVKAKLGSKAGDAESARRWLIQWLLDPHVHSPRSRMPVTHLTPEQAADVAAWLLDQEPTDMGTAWPELAVKTPELEKTLTAMTRDYFKPLLSDRNIDRLTKNELPEAIAESLPAEEKELALSGVKLETLKTYIGKKAVGRLGCFGCHDVPGFDNAKPIGTGLNDWGKKAPDRLAFEDIINYVKSHYDTNYGHDKNAHGHEQGKTDEHGKADEKVDQEHKKKLQYEEYYFDELVHHSRIGYLHQKLMEPRSYDYKRLRTWQDRARMPQFKFARTKKHPGEGEDEFQVRAAKEEADAREAVMTFILGLTAEALPPATIYRPQGDRLAEIKGRQVLDNYNCAGCHMIRPGVIEFNLDPETLAELESRFSLYKDSDTRKSEHVFYNHNAWVAQAPAPTGVMRTFGSNAKFVEKNSEDVVDPFFTFRLTSAMRVKDSEGKSNDFRAFEFIQVRPWNMISPPPSALTSEAALNQYLTNNGPYGGAFANLLVDYLIAQDEGNQPRRYEKTNSNAQISVPPILLRQGERTQPEWLYQFLLDPQPVRQVTVLRMPRFNMSKEEARALVNYFAAVDRTNNPGIGLKYPYEEIPQKDPFDSTYWRQKNAQYVSRLEQSKLLDQRVKDMEPVWKQILADYEQQLAAAETNLKEVDKAVEPIEKELEKVKEAKDAKTKAAEDRLKEAKQRQDSWKSEVDRLKSLVKNSSVEKQRENWKEKEAYVTDAYRLVANSTLCLTCHQVGGLQAAQKQTQGPMLHNVHGRLRPDWTRWWISHPQRFLTYTSVMPNNFPADKTQYQQWFVGSSLDQITAARDLLMAYPQAAELPANRYWALPAPKLPLTEGEAK